MTARTETAARNRKILHNRPEVLHHPLCGDFAIGVKPKGLHVGQGFARSTFEGGIVGAGKVNHSPKNRFAFLFRAIDHGL